MRRGQQADLARDQAGGKPHRESITIRADVQHVPACGQCRGDALHIREEMTGTNRAARAVRDDRIGERARSAEA